MDELQCALVAEHTRHVYRCVAMFVVCSKNIGLLGRVKAVWLLFYFYFFKLYLHQVLLV